EVFSPLPDVSPYQSPTWYDDLDDYYGYSRIADGATISGFLVTANVYYVNTTSPHAAATGRTYMKRIDITVSHSFYLDAASPFRISRFVSY
ncbi:MAG: hypothetical protein WD182_08510, partial [Bacteroidota bacterium]